jgi:hypothetical protein
VLGRALDSLLDDRESPEVRRDVTTLTVARLCANSCYRFAAPFLAIIARGVGVSLDQIGIALAIAELSRQLNEAPRRVELALSLRQLNSLVSLDQSLGSADAGDLTLLDTVTDGRRPEVEEDYAWLHGHLHKLSPLELNVLQQRYREGRGRSLMQLANQIGKTRYQVQVIEQRALRKLRAALIPVLQLARA